VSVVLGDTEARYKIQTIEILVEPKDGEYYTIKDLYIEECTKPSKPHGIEEY